MRRGRGIRSGCRVLVEQKAGTLTLFIAGTISGQWGLFRSTDGGASWIRINDDAHQYAGIDHVTGDMRTFGTVYFSGSGRGILWGTSAN